MHKKYTIIWKKFYDGNEHVHYEEYMERLNAETRMDYLTNIVKADAKIFYPEGK